MIPMTLFVRRSSYMGPVQAVVLDWAGTAVDFGSIAPAGVFVEVFDQFDVAVTLGEVRQFMGLAKRDHIRHLCALPAVSIRWRERYGHPPTETDIDQLYAQTEPMMTATVSRYADPIPGLVETVDVLRRQGVKIGSSTGYTSAIMKRLIPAAAQKGFTPDTIVCTSDVPSGRPFPWMCYLNAIRLQAYPLEAMVKIGDTIADIEAGLNAGMWTIGLTQSGNEMGLAQDELSRLSDRERQGRTDAISKRFRETGAHYAIAGVWDLVPVIDDINTRLAHGETP